MTVVTMELAAPSKELAVKESKLEHLRPRGAWARSLLPKGARSRPFGVEELQIEEGGHPRLQAGEMLQVENIKGTLEISSKTPNKTWCKVINLATDIHSANIHLFITKKQIDVHKFYLEVTRNIEQGEELYLWFSEELSAILDMPFLTPKNIIGYKKYRCHACDENFENPNPLKIHIFLSCRNESHQILWQHISKSLHRKLQPIPIESHPHKIPNLLSSDPPSSAFIPYKKSPTRHTSIQPLAQPLNLTLGSPPLQQQPPWTVDGSLLDLKLADVELFASNWGKLKHGHLCVYCGKVYSRKYGLKIHIRTHTGYKPLKCKYCLRPFGDPSNLNKHVRLHASGLATTQYACSLCGKVLVRRRDLERHLRSQHGEGYHEMGSD